MRRQATLRAVLVDAWLPRAAARHPDRAARSTRLTYAELLGAAGRAARRLAGARRRRRATASAIALPPGEAFCVALHACLLLGAVAVPSTCGSAAERAPRSRAARRRVVDGPLDGERRAT